MLPTEHRLRRAADFAHTVRDGARAGRGVVVIHLRASDSCAAGLEHADASRVGFVVSKKVGGAVVRNTVKRRLRAIMASRLGVVSGCDVVVRALPACAVAPYGRLVSDVDAALSAVVRRVRGVSPS